jgi:hypothetical protein
MPEKLNLQGEKTTQAEKRLETVKLVICLDRSIVYAPRRKLSFAALVSSFIHGFFRAHHAPVESMMKPVKEVP